jgi:alpha-amylase
VKYFYYDQTSSNIAALNKLVSYVRNDYPDLGFVGENWSSGSEYLDYYQSDIDSFFCFDGSVSSTGNASLVSATKGLTNANTFTKAIEAMETTIKASNSKAYSSYFLSNHDQDRVSKNLGQKYTAKLGASLTYLLPGTPYCYYGEEEQLKGTRGSEATDVMRRLPMIWSSSDRTGQCAFPDPSWQYLMDSFTQVSNGVEDLAKDPFSLLNHYRKVIQIRNKYPFLFKNGVFKAIPSGDSNIISYRLDLGTDNLTVVHNTRNIALECAVPYASAITDEIDTFDLKPRLQNGMLGLGPYSTVILSNR